MLEMTEATKTLVRRHYLGPQGKCIGQSFDSCMGSWLVCHMTVDSRPMKVSKKVEGGYICILEEFRKNM